MKVKASTNLILLISNITFLLSEVRNYHARLVKKNYHTQSVSRDNCRFGSSGLLPLKVKKRKFGKNKMFYLYAPGWPVYTLQVLQLQDKHAMILPCNEEICSSYSFWFYKKKNKLSRVRRVYAKHDKSSLSILPKYISAFAMQPWKI